MNQNKPTGTMLEPTRATPPILLGESKVGAPGSARWRSLLAFFMRTVSVLWMLHGLLLWRYMIVPNPSPLTELSPMTGGVVVAIAVLDFVAATGLWLVTPWGGILWVITCLAQFTSAIGGNAPVLGGKLQVALCVVLLAGYLALTYLAGAEQSREGP
ncbi:MAG: hypothetical protein KGQ46_10000 [Hyphomicrobiales bacterium]|nr:hypothetical protein [Hyphomicrobiales bacterium]MDE2114564.1 hypothetical protein [Hyphomicrobiales bacterium]